MKNQTKKINWNKLRNEYDKLRQDGGNLLAWCCDQANRVGMSYGAFMGKLGR